MKIFCKGNKGQAITEFVIIIPVLLMLFIGIFQLALISVARIKICMIERETMRYMTSEGEKPDDDKITAFVRECAANEGLLQDSISVIKGTTQGSGQHYMIVNNFNAGTFKIEYRMSLIRFFSIFKMDAITLSTSLFTATGGNMKFVLNGDNADKFNAGTGGLKKKMDDSGMDGL
jgi:hypothetical protein